jgi:hypothetical protein
MIDAMHDELKEQHQGGAFSWIDKNHDGAWTRANQKLDSALAEYGKTGDIGPAEVEIRLYKSTIIEFFKIYKEAKAQEAASAMFNYLEG